MSDTITINLNIFERKFLLFLSYNSGQVDMSHDNMKPELLKALDDLEKKGAITRIQLIGSSSKFQYKLTNIGTNLVDLIKDKSND